MIPVVFFLDLNREFFCRNSSCIYIVNLKRKMITARKPANSIGHGFKGICGSRQVNKGCNKHIPGYSGDFGVNYQDFH